MKESRLAPARAAARIANDLGLAACFGGTLFGKVIFNSSLPVIDSKTERGRLGAAFWNRSNPINAAAFGLAVATWLPGRLSSEGPGHGARGGVLDVCCKVFMPTTP